MLMPGRAGRLQFRADPDTISAVMSAADKEGLPIGALDKAPDLVKRVSILEQTVVDLKHRLK